MSADSHILSASFIDKLATMQFENVFNPYADICPQYDKSDAALIRRHNLELVLNAAISNGIDSIWIARDLGYRGGRRTGLALTDEVHLSWQAKLFCTPPLVQATQGLGLSERTANIVWRAIRLIEQPIFLWNVFPFHPHEPGNPMSNRCHKRFERIACQEFTLWLMEILHPKKVITIGRHAQAAMLELDIEAIQIRHPSYGGQTDFFAGLTELYGVSFKTEPLQCELF